MKFLERLMSIIVIFTTALFAICVSENIVLRSATLYSFYFNDTAAVSYVYTNLSNIEMAEGIADFMGSRNPENFQIYEDTGYMVEALFTEDESYNMMQFKKICDKFLKVGIISGIATVCIYFYFIDKKKSRYLMVPNLISGGLTLSILVGEFVMLNTQAGRSRLFDKCRFVELPASSDLLKLVGGEFIKMGSRFCCGVGLVVGIVVIYIGYRITRESRLFF